MEDSVRSRLYCIDVAHYETPESRSIMAMINRELDGTNIGLTGASTEFFERMQEINFLVEAVNRMIKCHLLVEPDVNFCLWRMKTYMQQLQVNHGAEMEGRHYFRNVGLARTLTIFQGVITLFYTPIMGWEPGRPFKFEDLLHIQPFLVGTEQIAIFTVTHLSPMILDPHRDIILTAMAKKLAWYPVRCAPALLTHRRVRTPTPSRSSSASTTDWVREPLPPRSSTTTIIYL
jgi:hypothetical protein